MAQYIAAAIQTVAAGANVRFTDEPVKGTPAIIHRDGSGIVTLRGCTDQCRARYKVTFGGNIAVAAGETAGAISVAITQQGEALPGATAIITPAAVAEYGNVFVAAYIDVPRGCCTTVGVENLSGIPINVQNASLIAERVA